MRSFSEIETTSKRASRAAGFSWGIAEEVGKNIRLLELFGLPGIKNLNRYYQNKKKNNFLDLTIINKENKSEKIFFCPIILGLSLMDQVIKVEKFKNCSLEKLAYPLLFLPFLSRSSEIIGKKILYKFDDNECLLNFNLNISSNLHNKDFPSKAENIQISFLENKDSFSETEWKSLYQLSENTFVDETDSLKQGAAGAGLTDND